MNENECLTNHTICLCAQSSLVFFFFSLVIGSIVLLKRLKAKTIWVCVYVFAFDICFCINVEVKSQFFFLHIACAIYNNVENFMSNDKNHTILPKLTIILTVHRFIPKKNNKKKMKNKNSCFETILEEKIILIPFCMKTFILR